MKAVHGLAATPQLASKALRIITPLIFVFVAACSESTDQGSPKQTPQATVSTKISFKGFSTGQVVSDELKKAKAGTHSWTYFSKPRSIGYKALADDVVVEIDIGLEGSLESSRLRAALEEKFKSEGSPNFRFHCVTEDSTLNFSDKSFSVVDESCYAFDDSQTLVIKTRRPKYEEPLAEKYRMVNLLLNLSSITLRESPPNSIEEAKKYHKSIEKYETNHSENLSDI